MTTKTNLAKLLAATSLAVAAMSAHATATDLIDNGSFELKGQHSSLDVNGWYVYSKMYGWTVDPTGGVEVRDNVAGSAQDGNNFIELDTDQRAQYGAGFVKDTNSWIAQTVKTKAGQTYTVDFWYAPREDTASNTNGIQLDVNGKAVHTYSGDSTQSGSTWKVDYKVDGKQVGATSGKNDSGNVWKDFSYTFVATGNSTTIKFQGVGNQDTYGGSLDNISMYKSGVVPAVPEPSTYALMALGIGALLLRGRFTRKDSFHAQAL
jgi:hypothetical protein